MDKLTIYTESPGGCRKRKREFNIEPKVQPATIKEPDLNSNGILNPAFTSSTPNKVSKRTVRRSSKRYSSQSVNKENLRYECMEVKSISEIHQYKKNEISKKKICNVTENPFEVVRKPPKKKQKSEIEESCFENAALNLEAPERTLNPFEIRRSTKPKTPVAVKNACFVNNGLDIRVEDTNINPYEIARVQSPIKNLNNGIENPALEIPSPTTVKFSSNLAIGLPFQPTLSCRIDFNNALLENFFQNETEIVPTKNCNMKQLLPVISEDEEIDIAEKLDCYQLELENSINEAKQKKAGIEIVKTKLKIIEETIQNEDVLENDETINDNNISGIEPLKVEKDGFINENKEKENCQKYNDHIVMGKEITIEQDVKNTSQITTPDIEIKKKSNDENEIILNKSCESNCESDFEEPTPFIRCYRKTLTNYDNPLVREKAISTKKEIDKEKKTTIGTAIRKSIRKFIIHPNKNNEEKIHEAKPIKEETEQLHHNQNIFQSIRQSLRRKGPKTEKYKSESQLKNKQNEISIIDCTERTRIFRSPSENSKTKDNKKGDKLKNIFSKNKYNF